MLVIRAFRKASSDEGALRVLRDVFFCGILTRAAGKLKMENGDVPQAERIEIPPAGGGPHPALRATFPKGEGFVRLPQAAGFGYSLREAGDFTIAPTGAVEILLRRKMRGGGGKETTNDRETV